MIMFSLGTIVGIIVGIIIGAFLIGLGGVIIYGV